jgi:hypothetical protein
LRFPAKSRKTASRLLTRGAYPTIDLSKNGAADATGGGTFVEIGDGRYYYEATQGEVDTAGWISLRAVKSGTTREYTIVIPIVAYDPHDSTRLGVVALPNAQPQSSGGLVTFGTGVGQLSVSSGLAAANLTQIDGQATNGYNATLKLKQLDIQNSAGTALIAKSTGGNGHGAELAGQGSGSGVRSNGGTNGCGMDLRGGGVGPGLQGIGGATNAPGAQFVGDGSGCGMVLETEGNNFGLFTVGGLGGISGSVTGNLIGNVQGNVTGSVNSVTTAVALPTGNDIYHADIAMDIDNTSSQDEYTVVWFKNGLPVAGTSPKIYAVNRSGAALIAADTSMVAVGSTNYFKYDATGAQRLPAGETAIVEVKATIDGAPRTFVREIPRNS